MAKRYPFNMSKFQHDIFFRYNRAKNELDERLSERSISAAEIEDYETLIDRLAELLQMGVGVVYLTGSEWGLANETVHWAANARKTTSTNGQSSMLICGPKS